jgi:hypothetical protein
MIIRAAPMRRAGRRCRLATEWAGARFLGQRSQLTVEYLTSFKGRPRLHDDRARRVKVAGQEKAAPMALRVTHIFARRRRIVLIPRHADPLIAKTPEVRAGKAMGTRCRRRVTVSK